MKKDLKRQEPVKTDQIPEAYIIKELEREKISRSSAWLIAPNATDHQGSLPYWPKPEHEISSGVIIIEL